MQISKVKSISICYEYSANLSFCAMNNYGCDEPIKIRMLCKNGKTVMN